MFAIRKKYIAYWFRNREITKKNERKYNYVIKIVMSLRKSKNVWIN